jgi:hypothetical protein
MFTFARVLSLCVLLCAAGLSAAAQTAGAQAPGAGSGNAGSAAATLSLIFDSDNSGGGSSDAGGILDFIQGRNVRARLHNSGQFEFMGGTKVSGGTQLFTGTYTDWRAAATQPLADGATLFKQGSDIYVNHYYRTPRNASGGGQFVIYSEIATDANDSNGTTGDRWVVPIYGGAISPANNAGTTALYGGNFNVQVSRGAAWPRFVRSVEADLNNVKADVALPEPSNAYGLGTLIGVEVISGGYHMPTYGIRVGATNQAPYNNRWRVGLRIGSDAWQYRAIELHDPPVSQGSGLITGQSLSTVDADTLNFARDSDAAPKGNFIRLRDKALTQSLFRVDNYGNVITRGLLAVGPTACSITSGAGSPEGAWAAPVCSLWLRTDGGPTTTLYVKTGGGSGPNGWTAR